MNTHETALSGEREVFVIDGLRSPFLKAKGKNGPFSAADMAVAVGRSLLLRQPFAPEELDEVILGTVLSQPDEVNVARLAALRMGVGRRVPAWTVQRNCGSGMQAVDAAARAIASGRGDLILAGGVEVMSRAPLLFDPAFADWAMSVPRLPGMWARLRHLLRFRPGMLKPVVALLKGLTDPTTDLTMGQTAEIVARRFGVSRGEMDLFAASSHQRLARAQKEGSLTREIVSLFDPSGQVLDRDDGVRPDTDPELLSRLPPVFDRPFGAVTAGNSAQVTDGACLLLLASAKAVQYHGLQPLGRIHPAHWVGLDPGEMGLGPAHAIAALLRSQGMPLEAVDFWEINEAFAGQVLASVRALEDGEYCREELGMSRGYGRLPMERLNVDGGAIALGHPVGASGARIILHLLSVLKREGGRLGVASLCIGGGQGGAVLLSV